MDDEERKQRAKDLQSPGAKLILEWAEEKGREAWEEFLKMPVDRKTSKAAFSASAKYLACKDLIEWVESEIKLGE